MWTPLHIYIWLSILKLCACDFIQSEDVKHVWHFKPILEHIVFVCHAPPSNEAHVSAWACCFKNDLNVWKCEILNPQAYHTQFFLFKLFTKTFYKCMIFFCLTICSDFKSHVMYTILKSKGPVLRRDTCERKKVSILRIKIRIIRCYFKIVWYKLVRLKSCS